MASVNYVKNQLEEAGLTVAVEGDFILCEDPGLFERSHDGVKGVANWLRATLEEYEEACTSLFEDSIDEDFPEGPKEEPVNIVEKNIQDEVLKLAPAPPEKDHRLDQLALAQEMNSPKEIYQAGLINDQDRGGIVNPEDYIRDMKLEAPATTILVRGHTFHAPDGWKIKEAQPNNTFYHGSINIGRKKNHELRGSKFSLVRDL